jgi:hypothetical protein
LIVECNHKSYYHNFSEEFNVKDKQKARELLHFGLPTISEGDVLIEEVKSRKTNKKKLIIKE